MVKVKKVDKNRSYFSSIADVKCLYSQAKTNSKPPLLATFKTRRRRRDKSAESILKSFFFLQITFDVIFDLRNLG